MTDLVLGALSGTRIGPPKVFVESLRASGADAEVVIFVEDVSEETRAYLTARSVTVVPFRAWRWWHGPVHAWRFTLFARFAEANAQRYRAIMVSDLRDVVIQSDPFAALETPAAHFFLEGGGYTLGTEPLNAKWMRRFVPPQNRAAYAASPISCCGVTLGGAAEMRNYLRAMAARLSRVPIWRRQNVGADTAMHNLIAHVTHDVPGVVAPNNGIVATIGLEPKASYRIDEKKRIALQDGHVPPVCHQYDRLPGLIEQTPYWAMAHG